MYSQHWNAETEVSSQVHEEIRLIRLIVSVIGTEDEFLIVFLICKESGGQLLSAEISHINRY